MVSEAWISSRASLIIRWSSVMHRTVRRQPGSRPPQCLELVWTLCSFSSWRRASAPVTGNKDVGGMLHESQPHPSLLAESEAQTRPCPPSGATLCGLVMPYHGLLPAPGPDRPCEGI